MEREEQGAVGGEPSGEPQAGAAEGTRVRELEGLLAEVTAREESARRESLAHLRRALLAEHGGQVVTELVRGETAAELEASVAAAREAFGKALETARAELAGTRAPLGNPAREQQSAVVLEGLSPLAKIAQGLQRP